MKKEIFSITMIFLIPILILTSGFSALELNLNKITPNPVEPGNDLVVELRLDNTNTDTIKINQITLDSKNKFLLKSVNNNYEEEIFCSQCSKTLTYYLTSKSNLESGTYPIEVEIFYDNSYSIKEEFFVKVQGKPELILNSKIDSKISPSKQFNIDLSLLNKGTNNAKNIKIISNTEEIGFLNENFLFLKELKQGEIANISGVMVSKGEIATGYYQIPIILNYEDSQNNNYQLNEKIGIEILNNANMIMQYLNLPSEIYNGEKFDMSIRLENDGFGKAKDVNVILEGDYEGSKKAYFGTMKKDEDFPYIFSLIPQKSGENNINLIINYKDDFGEHQTNYPINIIVKSKTGLVILENNYVKIGLGILLLILILSIIVILKRKNKENY